MSEVGGLTLQTEGGRGYDEAIASCTDLGVDHVAPHTVQVHVAGVDSFPGTQVSGEGPVQTDLM